jgi:CheY-like chemotaxis protein
VVESGRLTLSLEAVALDSVLLECQDMVAPAALKHGVRTTFPRVDTAINVLADRTRLKQVLINLLSNAIKYNRPGGTVSVECVPVAPDRVRIAIIDTGDGLTPTKLAQLFQSFNRLGQEAGAEEGTGIGLVVSKRLVELMGGVIGVESQVGVGSVFWIDMETTLETQVNAGEPESEVTAMLPPSDPAIRSLLYVEDNPANLKLVEQLIVRRPDMRLLSAGDGFRGIEIAKRARPDVILMDINLPGISGLEALRILLDDAETAHIPVIALSANAMPRDVERGLRAGFFRYLTKPIRVQEFNETLAAALAVAAERTASSDGVPPG